MNILMMTLLYPNDQLEEAAQSTKDKLQNQINNYQHSFIEGISANLKANEKLSILNSLPVGIFPFQYRQLFLKKGFHDNRKIQQLGAINLPWLKQKCRKWGAVRALRKWINESSENRTVLLYTQYLPYVEAVLKVKKQFPDLKASVIVTDLPNEYGLPTGRKGLLKKIEYRMGQKSMMLCRRLDGFVLLTQPMADVLAIQHKPYTVIEGLIQRNQPQDPFSHALCEKPAILYSGTLEPELGIDDLLQAFVNLPEYELWICGYGSMKEKVEQTAKEHANIRYYGFVPQKEALALQAKASALINPRSPQGAFTRYSFPSKTLEYLRSGKPVLCYKLEGIPADYDPYLYYISEPGSLGIEKTVRSLMKRSADERKMIGENGRQFVLREKAPAAQCKKLLFLLRGL